MTASPVRPVVDGVRVALRVTPGARREAVGGLAPQAGGGVALKISVTAVAEDGKANEAVLRLLAKTLKRPRRDFSVVVGATDRNKVIHIAGHAEDLARGLEPWLGAPGTGKQDQ